MINYEATHDNDNVLVYFKDKGFCSTFEINDVLDDLPFIAEVIILHDYRRFWFDEDLIQFYDRFYVLTNEEVNRICKLCPLYEYEGIKIDIAKDFPLNK